MYLWMYLLYHPKRCIVSSTYLISSQEKETRRIYLVPNNSGDCLQRFVTKEIFKLLTLSTHRPPETTLS